MLKMLRDSKRATFLVTNRLENIAYCSRQSLRERSNCFGNKGTQTRLIYSFTRSGDSS
ncbi:hypothetical protein NC652_007677 [Populus alba x Populus x berolinensis]|nr:hypothetical protein NC652_007677 [Populus alba x Populus x berolinensis]